MLVGPEIHVEALAWHPGDDGADAGPGGEPGLEDGEPEPGEAQGGDEKRPLGRARRQGLSAEYRCFSQ